MSEHTGKKEKLTVFISYSHADKALKDELSVALSGLMRQKHLAVWFDNCIDPGADIDLAISRALTVPAAQQPTPITALAVAGMNDVLNSEGYTQAAWWNRIPTAAWMLMAFIALGCNLLLGFGERRLATEPALMLVLPLLVAISLGLIADIDSPRGGLIRVAPQNLHALKASLSQ